MILYHVTERENVPTILTHGLIPLYRLGLMRNWPADQRPKSVWLTDDPAWIMEHQVGLFQEERYSIFDVNCYGLEVRQFSWNISTKPIISEHEFLHDGEIEPFRLRLMKR